MSREPASRARVAAWQQHLREGGTTPWEDFSGSTTSTVAAASAVHLELVRRLDSSLPRFTALADLVLATPVPGRGRVDVPLPGGTAHPYGTPPVDPGSLPATELLRLAVGVLDRLIGDPPALPSPSPGAVRPRRHFQVAGTPIAGAMARQALLGAGWREHPRRARQFVFGAPLPDAVAQLWTHRVVTGGSTTPWPELWRRLAARGELPRRLRFEELVRSSGRRGLPVFGSLEETAALLRRDHGLQMEPSMDLVATSLVRRLNTVLATRMTQEVRQRVTPVITEVVGRSSDPIDRLRVPAAHRNWATARRAEEPDYPQDSPHRPPRLVPVERTLGLALDAVGRGWVRHLKESD